MKRRRNTRIRSANYVYSRNYYTRNICCYRNCIFNRNGRCLRLKREQGKEPLTYNKGCFMSAIEGRTMEEIRKYFRNDTYVIKRDLLPTHISVEELFKPVLEREVRIERVKDPTLVEVTFKTGNHIQHSTLFLRDLFAYELDNREREYEEEEERLGKYIDLDAIRSVNNTKPTV